MLRKALRAGFPRAPACASSASSRFLHATAPAQNTALLAGLTVAAGAMAARYGIQAYERATGGAPGGAPGGATGGTPGADAGASAGGSSARAASDAASDAGAAADAGGARAGAGASADGAAKTHKTFGAEMLAKRFYRGGFEDKMTRREAALILGVRESATTERIRERHRKMLMLNHPDMGGSTYLAGKVNEAKDLFLKPQK
jgi:hypothetical protein